MDSDEDSPLVTLSFALSVLGRRSLSTAAHNRSNRYTSNISDVYLNTRQIKYLIKDNGYFNGSESRIPNKMCTAIIRAGSHRMLFCFEKCKMRAVEWGKRKVSRKDELILT